MNCPLSVRVRRSQLRHRSDHSEAALRACPYCGHRHTKLKNTAKATGVQTWSCLCKTINSCNECPNCKRAHITDDDCVCPTRLDSCKCGKALLGESNRICVQMECECVLGLGTGEDER